MKKSSLIDTSKLIGSAVYNVKANYEEKQNLTKIKYFDYLNKGKSVEDFSKEVKKIWGNIDHKFMNKQIAKLQEAIHSNNVAQAIDIGRILGIEYYKSTGKWVIDDKYFKLIPESEFKKIENLFQERVIKSYNKSNKTIDKVDKDYYLEKKIDSYDEEVNQLVAYYGKGGGIQRHVQVSSYLSMLHNVDLTRSGWNQTMIDADRLNAEYFIIPTHPFSCEECQMYQNRPLSRYEVESIIGTEAEEQSDDILHPNCKCTLSILWDNSQIKKDDFTIIEKEEQYNIRQQVNSYSLTKDKLETDKVIANKLGNQEQVDKINNRINKIDNKITKLVNTLSTPSLRKQVEAINR